MSTSRDGGARNHCSARNRSPSRSCTPSRRSSVRVLRAGSIRAERPVPQHPLWRAEARIHIEEVYPELDGGRYPVKRIVGELFEVWADMFRDGHDKLRAV